MPRIEQTELCLKAETTEVSIHWLSTWLALTAGALMVFGYFMNVHDHKVIAGAGLAALGLGFYALRKLRQGYLRIAQLQANLDQGCNKG